MLNRKDKNEFIKNVIKILEEYNDFLEISRFQNHQNDLKIDMMVIRNKLAKKLLKSNFIKK